MEEIDGVWLRPGVEVSNAMVVVAAPTLGFVGPITARYLVGELDMERIGGMIPSTLPPVARVGQGRPSFPIALHKRETRCGLDGDCEHLVVVETELGADVRTQHAIAKTLVDWATEQEACSLLSPDGLVVEEDESQTVRGVASNDEAAAKLPGEGVELMEGGYIAGLSAALLCYSETVGLETVCLLAESNPGYPDARAAARIVGVLDRIIPEISIETKPLIEEAERIEEHVRSEMDRLRSQSQEMPPDPGMMFG